MSFSATITLLILAAIIFSIINIQNQLVTLRNRYKNAFAQIEVQLKRRYDLIPNLVETAKGYLKHESQTLEAVTSARNAAHAGLQSAAADPSSASAIKQLSRAEGELSGALGRLNVVMEAYPDLKANQNMMQITEELTSTENKVSFARQAYNDAAMTYNTAREVFPNNLVVGFGDFPAAELFQVTAPAEREAVKVQF